MPRPATTLFLLFLLSLLLAGTGEAAPAGPATVCTITVNSPDEREAFRQRLPQGQYRFVELVEKGRDDWLETACTRAIRCDVLVVSGHFNAGDTFYSDKVEGDEHLSVDALERAACSGSCPALFAQLREVYLFGCESLNPDAGRYASSQGESGRDRMRRIFAGVPAIYGFTSSAPVGPTAAMLLNRHFDSGASGFGTGRPSARLLGTFAPNHMGVTRGAREPHELARREQACRLVDTRIAPGARIGHIGELARRGGAELRASFDRIEQVLGALTATERESPAFAHALAELSADDDARDRFLAATRATAEPALRSRMIAVAATLGWLPPEAHKAERVELINAALASRAPGFAEVDLACTLNHAGDLDAERARVRIPASRAGQSAPTAILACLGSPVARARTLAALASADDRDVQVAQAYLRHRPVSDPLELRAMARAIGDMPATVAQVRAIDALGRMNVTDRATLELLAGTFAASRSVETQRAIAEAFLRSGASATAQADLITVLRRHRIRSAGGTALAASFPRIFGSLPRAGSSEQPAPSPDERRLLAASLGGAPVHPRSPAYTGNSSLE